MGMCDTFVVLRGETNDWKQVILPPGEIKHDVLGTIVPLLHILIPIGLVLGDTPVGSLSEVLDCLVVLHLDHNDITILEHLLILHTFNVGDEVHERLLVPLEVGAGDMT